MYSFSLSRRVSRAIIVGQQPTTQTGSNQVQLTLPELIIGGGLVGLLTALGVPYVIRLLAQTRAEGVQSDRRREDSVYKTLLDNSQKAQDNLTETVRTLMANQTSQTSELFQLANMMVVEVKELREVVSSMVLQDHKKTEVIERFNYELQELKALIEQKTEHTVRS